MMRTTNEPPGKVAIQRRTRHSHPAVSKASFINITRLLLLNAESGASHIRTPPIPLCLRLFSADFLQTLHNVVSAASEIVVQATIFGI